MSDYTSTATKVNASALHMVSLVGTATTNSLKGRKYADTISGGDGNDSALGVAVNDTLTGGTGNDTFVYGGEGKDVITDYTADADTIKISRGSITKTAYSGNNVIFTVGSGTLIVKNAKGKAISSTDASSETSTKTYTTGMTYGSNGLRGSNGYWFADDTNFIGETNIDAISAENYAVTNIEATRVENLVMNDSLISALTFATK